MKEKNNKVSVNNFEMALDKEDIVTVTLEGTENVSVQIKKTLSLPEMISFVKYVVESCVDGETGEYTPEAYDFAVKVSVLTRYANFTMPTKLEKQYDLVYNTKAFHQVMAYIDEYQFNEIIRAIDRKIKYMLDVMSSAAVSKIYEVIDKFNNLSESISSSFGNVSAEEIEGFVKGMSKLKDVGELDIARAVLENKAVKTDE